MAVFFINLAASSSTDYGKLSENLSTVTIAFYVLACVFFAFAVFSFIIFKIPNVIGDLSGRNARKSIAQMRENNEKSGKKSYRPHPVASERGTVTEPITQKKNGSRQLSKTEKTSAKPKQTAAKKPNDNATVKLDYDKNATEVLNTGTEVLKEEDLSAAVNAPKLKMKMIQDIVFIHTEETI